MINYERFRYVCYNVTNSSVIKGCSSQGKQTFVNRKNDMTLPISQPAWDRLYLFSLLLFHRFLFTLDATYGVYWGENRKILFML